MAANITAPELTPSNADAPEDRFSSVLAVWDEMLAAERPARPKIFSMGSVDYVLDAVSGLWRARAK